jgi:ATP-dependent RNA circularization protein (DNA/RNA ligase family)
VFRKYEKTFRIEVPNISIQGKKTLSEEEAEQLLSGFVYIEEKLDGANTAIFRDTDISFVLQKRGSVIGTGEPHPQFHFFLNWANERYLDLLKVPKGFYVYGELMYAVHQIYYDSLPDYFLVFDIFDGDEWLDRDTRDVFCREYRFEQVPLLALGTFKVNELYRLIPNQSVFGSEPAEGIVIKKYNKDGYLRAKLVRPEFTTNLDENDEHWTRKRLRTNKVVEYERR